MVRWTDMPKKEDPASPKAIQSKSSIQLLLMSYSNSHFSHSLSIIKHSLYLPLPHKHLHISISMPSHSSLSLFSTQPSLMATNRLQSINHNTHVFKHNSITETPPSTLSSSIFLKPNTTTNTSLSLSQSHSSTVIYSLSPTSTSLSTPSTSSNTISFDFLQHHLSNQDFRQADEETRRLLIVLAGDFAKKRGYVFFSEVKLISETDLKAIDDLWKQYSNNRFGYSVQKRIFEKVNRDFTKLFIKLGWMKKLDSEIEQYNYRSFPTEFIWELNDDTPEGHLPLTNALRGTQLFNSILTHPAFENTDEEEEDKVRGEDKGKDKIAEIKGLRDVSKPSSNKEFKPDYSF